MAIILRTAEPVEGYITKLIEVSGKYTFVIMWKVPQQEKQMVIAFRVLRIDREGRAKLKDNTLKEEYIDKLFQTLNDEDAPHFDYYLEQFIATLPSQKANHSESGN